MRCRMNFLKYWILRLRDVVFSPRRLGELWDWHLRRGKYSYLSQRLDDEIRKAWRRRQKEYRRGLC